MQCILIYPSCIGVWASRGVELITVAKSSSESNAARCLSGMEGHAESGSDGDSLATLITKRFFNRIHLNVLEDKRSSKV